MLFRSAIAMPAYQDYTARAQATEGFKATSGVQADIATFVVDQNRWPQPADDIGVAAALLEGKYFVKGGVTLTGGDAAGTTSPTTPSVINIAFSSGANGGKTMMLTPTLVAATGQISKWVCAPGATNGIETKRLPASCQ